MRIPVLHQKDGYKVGHPFQYPPGTNMVYSNLTPRQSRLPGVSEVVAFGFQYFIEEYLVRQWNLSFFHRPLEEVIRQYKRRITNYLGPIDLDHVVELHELGYLPLKIKAVPEGMMVPLRVPLLTIRNTHPSAYWLTNSIESIMSNVLWKAMTSATIAVQYRRTFQEWAALTGASKEFIPWQAHDFSFRGMSGLEDACLSGAGHLLSFTGSDTIPAIDFLEEYYLADSDSELIAGSVPATEHSVMCAGGETGEQATFERLFSTYPTGVLSVVSDTWDLWSVLTDILPALKDQIMARDGKLVIRPDSGDPVDIICGDPNSSDYRAQAGAVQLLWEVFGGTKNEKGFATLDPHVGVIYGDSITLERQYEILRRLAQDGFASDNVVLGVGSYTYQYQTRDSLGLAMKATYVEVMGHGYPISKDPVTDDGVKKSASGLLYVGYDDETNLIVEENVTWERENQGVLETIFHDGQITRFETLKGIRDRVAAST